MIDNSETGEDFSIEQSQYCATHDKIEQESDEASFEANLKVACV